MKKTIHLLRSKWREYLMEMAVIIIGILLAIGLNNWNQRRIDRGQEREILLQLRAEFDANIVEIDNKIEMRRGIIAASKSLLGFVDNPSMIYSSGHIDSLMNRTMFYPTFDPNAGVTNQLLQSEKLYLISNSEIRRLISA